MDRSWKSAGNVSAFVNLPPGILAGALVFWGWQAGFLWLGLMGGVVLELARWSPWHWQFGETDFNRVWDVTSVLFLGAALYCYNGSERLRSGYLFFQYFPLIFLPMTAAQLFGRAPALQASTFSWFLRRRKRVQEEEAWVDFRQIYFGLCLLGAGATNGSGWFFFAGFSILLSWALWPRRSPRVPAWVWAAILVVVIGAGRYGQEKLHEWQGLLEAKTSEWLARFVRRESDPRESRTRMGQIGVRKLSGRVVYHVQPATKEGKVPELLRQASYDAFSQGTWYATRRDSEPLAFDSEIGGWVLGGVSNKVPEQVRISGFLPGGEGLLALPSGTMQIQNLPATEVRRSAFGVVRVREGPGFMDYLAGFARGVDMDDPPDPSDRRLPDPERGLILKIASDLGLLNRAPEEVERRIARYFREQFTYAMYVPENDRNRAGGRTPLEQFLVVTHQGHCEYFATATVLLLRAAGIPARYATGFGVMETSKKGNVYLVRERHAHAWALAHRNGHWEDFDTTPPSWDQVEEAASPAWEPISDLWSGFWFGWSAWRWSSDKGWLGQYGPMVLLPVALGLMARVFYQRRRGRIEPDGRLTVTEAWPGSDSEFYRVLELLGKSGVPRERGETISAWLRRQENLVEVRDWVETARRLLPLHYRYRFDPAGLAKGERDELARVAEGR